MCGRTHTQPHDIGWTFSDTIYWGKRNENVRVRARYTHLENVHVLVRLRLCDTDRDTVTDPDTVEPLRLVLPILFLLLSLPVENSSHDEAETSFAQGNEDEMIYRCHVAPKMK